MLLYILYYAFYIDYVFVVFSLTLSQCLYKLSADKEFYGIEAALHSYVMSLAQTHFKIGTARLIIYDGYKAIHRCEQYSNICTNISAKQKLIRFDRCPLFQIVLGFKMHCTTKYLITRSHCINFDLIEI